MLADQMISRVEYLHSRSFIHRHVYLGAEHCVGPRHQTSWELY